MADDYEVSRLKAEIESIDSQIDQIQYTIEPYRSRKAAVAEQIGSLKEKIADYKRQREQEFESARICRQNRQRDYADQHRYNAQSWSDSISRAYDELNSYRAQMDQIKSESDSLFERRRDLIERKKRLKEQLFARIEQLKQERASKAAEWKIAYCAKCGGEIRYHIQWSHIPKLCKSCKEQEAQMWAEKPCAKCGQTIRFRRDWDRPPSLCKSCKEQEAQMWAEKPCAKCGKMFRYRRDWDHPPNVCKSCKGR